VTLAYPLVESSSTMENMALRVSGGVNEHTVHAAPSCCSMLINGETLQPPVPATNQPDATHVLAEVGHHTHMDHVGVAGGRLSMAG
jgi:hypothetical protein